MNKKATNHTHNLKAGIRKTRISRLVLMLVVALGLISASLFVIYQNYNQILTNQDIVERERLSAIVNTLADHIDGNKYEEMLENNLNLDGISDLNQNRTYDELHQILKTAKEKNGLKEEIYTLTLRDGVATKSLNNAAFFGVTSRSKPYYRHPYTPSNYFVEHYLSGGVLDTYTDSHGTWVSAIAPIYNDDDQVVGVVEADVQIDDLLKAADEKFSTIVMYIIVFTLVLLLITLSLVAYITRRFLVAQKAINESFEEVNSTFNQLSDFAEEIGKGNYDVETAPIEALNNSLSAALLQMKENLHTSREAEQKRQWVIQGIAEFGSLLRDNNSDVTALCQSAISRLSEYVGARQGLIYLLDEEDGEQFLKVVGTYAFEDEQHHRSVRIGKGEGMVGQVWVEQETAFFDEVPDNFFKINSALGSATPRSVLIVPLVHNTEVYGVLEIASLKVLQPHEIEFVEKVTESIASTVSIVQVNARTSKLLDESKAMSEKFQMQEEEMRQNTEELQATQEEMQRRLSKMSGKKGGPEEKTPKED